MRIIIDENIPLAESAFALFGDVRPFPGHHISKDTIRNADALIVRSVTPVGEGLLDGSDIRFVGSATAGIDHIDCDYLQSRGIHFAHAPGSNATAVVEYVLAALAAVAADMREDLLGRTTGIIGYGHVGSALAERLEALNHRVLVCDPPLAERDTGGGDGPDFTSLVRLRSEVTIFSLHVPMQRKGPHATYHLLDHGFFSRIKRGAWIVNTSRGHVIEEPSLLQAVLNGAVGAAALDVWAGEPEICMPLMNASTLATPHIAGYSVDAKIRGAEMIYAKLSEFTGMKRSLPVEAVEKTVHRLESPEHVTGETEWLHGLIRQMYDIRSDDRNLRSVGPSGPLNHAEHFRLLRKTYPPRRSFERFALRKSSVPVELRHAVEFGLRVKLT